MKYWVNPQSGWRYNFPKIWDSETHPNMIEWVILQGYPKAEFDKWGALISETPPKAWKCEIKMIES